MFVFGVCIFLPFSQRSMVRRYVVSSFSLWRSSRIFPAFLFEISINHATSSLFVGLQVPSCKFFGEGGAHRSVRMCTCILSHSFLSAHSRHDMEISTLVNMRGYSSVHAFTRLRQLVKQICINYYVFPVLVLRLQRTRNFGSFCYWCERNFSAVN